MLLCIPFYHAILTSFSNKFLAHTIWYNTIWLTVFAGTHVAQTGARASIQHLLHMVHFQKLILKIYYADPLTLQFLIFEPLSYCFKETIEFWRKGLVCKSSTVASNQLI